MTMPSSPPQLATRHETSRLNSFGGYVSSDPGCVEDERGFHARWRILALIRIDASFRGRAGVPTASRTFSSEQNRGISASGTLSETTHGDTEHHGK